MARLRASLRWPSGAVSVAIRFSLTVPYGSNLTLNSERAMNMTVQYGQIKPGAKASEPRDEMIDDTQTHRWRAIAMMAGASLAISALAACASLPGEETKPQTKPVTAYQTDRSLAAPASDW